MSVISGIYGAEAGKDATEDAAAQSAGTQWMMYSDLAKRQKPYEELGYEGVSGLREFDSKYKYPSYEELVYGPMESWKYEESPAFKAKYTLGMEELNKQLQARGLAPSGVGANRAADLSRRLTAEDYGTEREYRRAGLRDRYSALFDENRNRYDRLLDMVKIGQGSAAATGQAGQRFADRASESAMAAGNARAGFYQGLGGMSGNTAATGLKMYDFGKDQGWWGGGGGGAGYADYSESNYAADDPAAFGNY